MHIQGARIAGIVCFPNLLKEIFPLNDFTAVLQQDLQQQSQPGSQPGVLAQAFDPAVFNIQTDWPGMDDIVAIPG